MLKAMHPSFRDNPRSLILSWMLALCADIPAGRSRAPRGTAFNAKNRYRKLRQALETLQYGKGPLAELCVGVRLGRADLL